MNREKESKSTRYFSSTISHGIRKNILRRAVFEAGVRFIGVGQDGGCASGGVLEGLRGSVEASSAEAADGTFVGAGTGRRVDAHDEPMTQVGRWICAVAKFLSRIQCCIKKHNIKPGRHRPEVGDRRSPFPGPISEDRKHAKRVSRILCHLGIVSFGVFNLHSAIADPHGYYYRRPIAAQRFCLFQHQLRRFSLQLYFRRMRRTIARILARALSRNVQSTVMLAEMVQRRR